MVTLKDVMRLFLSAALISAFGCGDGDRFDARRISTPLIGDILSYQKLEDFETSLGATYVWEVLPREHSGFGGDKYRPPFKVESLLVRGFVHLGHKGDLLVIFFNNKLAKTLFFPLRRDEYLFTLSSEVGRDVISSKGLTIRPHVRVWTAIDHQGKSYVGWEDIRLADEMTRWIKKYA